MKSSWNEERLDNLAESIDRRGGYAQFFCEKDGEFTAMVVITNNDLADLGFFKGEFFLLFSEGKEEHAQRFALYLIPSAVITFIRKWVYGMKFFYYDPISQTVESKTHIVNDPIFFMALEIGKTYARNISLLKRELGE